MHFIKLLSTIRPMETITRLPTIVKYIGNARLGYQGALQGEFVEFKSFPEEELRKRFGITLTFDESSQQEFLKRITEPLQKVAESTGAELFMAGIDFPLHSTVLEIKREDAVIPEKEEKMRKIILGENNIRRLPGLTLSFDYMFVDKGGNTVIAATNIPQVILSARETVSSDGIREGFSPLPLTNILHISVARLTKLPDESNMTQYYKMSGIRPALRFKPLQMTVGSVNAENTWNFLNRI
ncbi:MAG: hypothetical protein UX91_C0002G0036 [Candidatus Amesbacteria bacterium GW2011_GWB1_47_19]|nr:MAG: hypothetical protein UW51_C0004G0036 [Candidatus Amesbacteria bacterium GW2011_GWA1_44_24]KKU31711.1 MAG: hypothetical protein UX46_C0003G0036 [Candidatus Amesbacteria bacterium GW2011_GWC1_46_24]KKU67624.1 MAG: hypothetical protein UX91_C0002G0036 [Candidatus Amesbacteria bacterium GW2011_GWB1_47_19]